MNIIDQAITYYVNEKTDLEKAAAIQRLKNELGKDATDKEIVAAFSNWMAKPNSVKDEVHQDPDKISELNKRVESVCAFLDSHSYRYTVYKNSDDYIEIEFKIITERCKAKILLSFYLNSHHIAFFTLSAFTGIIADEANEIPVMMEINALNRENYFGRFIFDEYSKEIYFESNHILNANFDDALFEIYYDKMIEILEENYLRIRQTAYGQMKREKIRKVISIINNYFQEIDRTHFLETISKQRRYKNG